MLIGHARAHSVLHVHHKRTVWLQPGYVHRDRHALEPATAHCPDEGPLRRRRFVRGAQQAHRRRRCLYRGLGEASLEKRAIEWAERRSRYEIRCVQSPPDGGLRSKRDWRMCERQGLPTIAGAKREDTIAQDILQGYSESDTSYINLYQGHSLEWECFQNSEKLWPEWAPRRRTRPRRPQSRRPGRASYPQSPPSRTQGGSQRLCRLRHS
jgi:hypothetical protein